MRKILLLAPMPTHPPTAGNRQRILSLANRMRICGNEVHFADLSPILSSARVFLNAVKCGTGLKIKALEALAAGLPVVSTPEGMAGLHEAEAHGILIGKTDAEFADHVVHLLSDNKFYEEHSDAALLFVEQANAKVKDKIKELLALS